MIVRKIIADEVYLNKFGRFTFQVDAEIDLPYLAGKFNDLVPADFKKNSTAFIVERQYINDTMLFNEAIEVGSRGLYYLVLQKGYKIDKLLYHPEELNVDLYVHKDGRLIYSFYNPTRKRNINLRGKISEDYDKVASKIKANLDDILFRNYFLQLATENYGNEPKIPEYFPTIMNVKQVASYLNTSEKTIRKWTSEKKIPVTKIGNTVKYRKKDLDNYLDKQSTYPHKH